MIKSKSLKYTCFWICNVDTKFIDWICNWRKLIFQYELNEHCNKTQNQNCTRRRTTQHHT